MTFSSLEPIGCATISSPDAASLLNKPHFAAGLCQALARAASVPLLKQSIGCFVQDNRQTVLKFPDAHRVYLTPARSAPGGSPGCTGSTHESGCAVGCVKLSLMLGLRAGAQTESWHDFGSGAQIVLVPFAFDVADDHEHTLAPRVLNYSMRLDVVWQNGSNDAPSCSLTLRRSRLPVHQDVPEPHINFELLCSELQRQWNGVSPSSGLCANETALQFAFSEDERTRLAGAIASVQDWIAAGNCYLANLTTIIDLKISDMAQSLQEYLQRWGRTPSRFGWFVSLPRLHIESYSPERFFSIIDGVITTEPIKGTVTVSDSSPRNSVAEQLWASEKETCEQHLVTDLLRNDLHAVCETSSVHVISPLEVRLCSGLGQMTSVISGRLRRDLDLERLLGATLPAGSVTGAPKRAVCSLLRRLEVRPRRFYCGLCIDHESRTSIEATLLIRTLFREGDQSYAGTGAGITALSEPRQEILEMENKLSSFLARCHRGPSAR